MRRSVAGQSATAVKFTAALVISSGLGGGQRYKEAARREAVLLGRDVDEAESIEPRADVFTDKKRKTPVGATYEPPGR